MQSEAAISAGLAAVRGGGSSRSGSWYARIVRALVSAVVVLIPLLYLPWTASILEYNKQLVLVVAAAVGLVTWLLGIVVTGKLTVRSTPVDKGIFAILGATLIAAALSLTPVRSIFGLNISLSDSLVTVIALAVIYFLAVNTFHDQGRMLRRAVMLSVGLALLAGLLQMFAQYVLPGSFTHSRAFTTVGQLNVLGILAAVALPLFAKAGRGPAWIAVSLVGSALSLVVLAILNWWVLWVVALAGMLAMIAFDSLNVAQLSDDYSARKGRFALSRFIVPIVVIVLGAFLLLVRFNFSSVKSNLPVEIAPSQRLSWDVAKGVFKDDFVTGWGPENFSLAFDRFAAGSLANTRLASLRFFDGASEFANTAVHTGVLGLLALALLGWCLVQVLARFGGAISASRARGDDASWAAESSGTLAALAAIVVAFFLYPFNIVLATVGVVLLALAGLIVAGDRQRTVDIEERPLFSLAASLGFIVGLILVLSGLYFTSVRYLADVRYANALGKSNAEEAMTQLVRAIDLNPTNDQYLRDGSQLALALLRDEIAKGAQADPARTQNLVATAIQLAQRSAQTAPDEAANWRNLGVVYQAMTGLVENVEQLAEDAFNKGAELRPGDPTFDNQSGQMWLARADLIRRLAPKNTVAYNDSLTRAEAAFKRAIEKSPTYGLAIYNLGAVYERQGRVDEAIAQLEKIAPFNANEPTLMFELGLLYIRASQYDDAEAAMRRAVLLSPKFANARWYLALLFERKGDLGGAVGQLYEVLKDNSDNEILKAKIAQLQAGQQAIPPAEVIDTEPLE